MASIAEPAAAIGQHRRPGAQQLQGLLLQVVEIQGAAALLEPLETAPGLQEQLGQLMPMFQQMLAGKGASAPKP